MSTHIPELALDPPEDRYIYTDCGHEVFAGEDFFANENGMTRCPECMDAMFEDLGTYEKAALLGYHSQSVEFPQI